MCVDVTTNTAEESPKMQMYTKGRNAVAKMESSQRKLPWNADGKRNGAVGVPFAEITKI